MKIQIWLMYAKREGFLRTLAWTKKLGESSQVDTKPNRGAQETEGNHNAWDIGLSQGARATIELGSTQTTKLLINSGGQATKQLGRPNQKVRRLNCSATQVAKSRDPVTKQLRRSSREVELSNNLGGWVEMLNCRTTQVAKSRDREVEFQNAPKGQVRRWPCQETQVVESRGWEAELGGREVKL